MARKHRVSEKDKVLWLIGGALLVVVAIVGLASAQESTTSASGEDTLSQKRHLTDELNHAKNLRREVEDIKRETKNAADTSVAERHVSAYDACLNDLASFVGTNHFWENTSKCSDSSNAVNDELQDKLRPMRDCANFSGNLKDRTREFKDNIERQLKDLKRGNKTADFSALDAQKAKVSETLAKYEQAIPTCNPDTIDTVRDLQRDTDDAFRDWYDVSNEVGEVVNTVRRLEENRQDFDKNLKRQCDKDYAREMKNAEKDYAKIEKTGGLTDEMKQAFDVTRDLYSKICTVQIQAMQDALNSSDMDAFDDARNEYHNLNRDFWETLNTARESLNKQQQSKDVLREITQREKDIVNMRKEYERTVKKHGAEIPRTKEILEQFGSLLAEAKNAAVQDPQSWWQDYQQQIGDLQNEFWDSFQQIQRVAELERFFKERSEEIRFREKDLKNMKRDKELDTGVLDQLAEIVERMKAVLKEAQDVRATDPEQAFDILIGFDDLRFEWDETNRGLWEKKQVEFETGRILHEIEFAEKQVKKMIRAREISSDEADKCTNFLGEVRERISANDFQGTDAEALFEELEDDFFAACPFEDQFDEGDGPGHEYYQDFLEENTQNIDTGATADMLERVSEDVASRIVQRILSDPSAIQNLMQAAGVKFKDAAQGTIEAGSTFYDAQSERDLLARKAEILALTQKLEEVQAQLKLAQDKLAELQAIQQEIADYNFYGSAGENIQEDITAFVEKAQSGNLSKEEIRAGIAELKTKKEEAIQSSKEAKLEAKIIPFLDTDDNIWYTKFVAPLAQLGIVRGKGDGKNFDPSAQVTVAEVITMAFRISGDPEVSGASTICNGKFKDHWANSFLLWAERKGLSVVGKCTDVNRPAVRWEVAQALLEAANHDIPESGEQCFKDVKTTDQPVNSVVCAAQKAGIMKGTDGSANASKNVIRAEAATMVKQAAEKLLGVKFGKHEEKEQPKARLEKRPSSNDDEEDEGEEEEEEEEDDGDLSSSAAHPSDRNWCYYDDGCESKVGSSKVTRNECRDLLGGSSWGGGPENCEAL